MVFFHEIRHSKMTLKKKPGLKALPLKKIGQKWGTFMMDTPGYVRQAGHQSLGEFESQVASTTTWKGQVPGGGVVR